MSAVPSPRRRVPAPPRPRAAPPRSPLLPVVDETSAGGLVVRVEDRQAFTAVIARRNRGGRPSRPGSPDVAPSCAGRPHRPGQL